MSFSSSFLGGVSKISANVTEGRSQGAITKVSMIKKTATAFLSLLQGSLCVTRRLGRGDLRGARRGRTLSIVVGYGTRGARKKHIK